MSTAYHLALELKTRGKGSGTDILVVDKTGVGAGASGIACGGGAQQLFSIGHAPTYGSFRWKYGKVTRKTFSYHPVGYMQLSPEIMREDVAGIASQQKEIGYASEFIEGEADCMKIHEEPL